MYLSNKGPIPLTDKIRNKILETNHTYAKMAYEYWLVVIKIIGITLKVWIKMKII